MLNRNLSLSTSVREWKIKDECVQKKEEAKWKNCAKLKVI